MRRLIAIIFFVTCFPTIVLVGTAIYLGQGFKARASDQYDATRSVGKVVGVANPDGSQDENADQKDWQSLFDGQSLEQWEGKEKVFRIQEKSIVAGSLLKKIPNNEFLCTRKKYGNFELKLQAAGYVDFSMVTRSFVTRKIPLEQAKDTIVVPSSVSNPMPHKVVSSVDPITIPSRFLR